MTDGPELGIFRAAKSEPERAALIADGARYSYKDIAALVRSRMKALEADGVGRDAPFHAVAPTADVDSLLTIFALFALRVPAVLLHPRWTTVQRRDRIAQASRSAPLRRVRPAAVVFTSGSTAEPKGVMLTEETLVASAQAHTAMFGWRDNDRWLLCMPPAHVGGLSVVTRCLLARRCVVLGSAGAFDGAAVRDTIERHRVTLLSVVPTMLHRLIDDPDWEPPSHLRAVLVGGASLPNTLRARAVAQGVAVRSTYGLSEACSQVATQSAEETGTSGSGKCLPGTDLRFVNDEIEVRGPTLMSGYLDGSDAELWRDDGWFATGDMGRLAQDGQLQVRGRVDDLIVTGGENVMPQEVEHALLALNDVRSACVFGVEDAEWGEVVAAVVVLGGGISLAEIQSRMTEVLADFQRPRKWCVAESLPTTPSGKVLRPRVRDDFANRLKTV